jgi:hypothetical protein
MIVAIGEASSHREAGKVRMRSAARVDMKAQPMQEAA